LKTTKMLPKCKRG